jgi:hypothetical protein
MDKVWLLAFGFCFGLKRNQRHLLMHAKYIRQQATSYKYSTMHVPCPAKGKGFWTPLRALFKGQSTAFTLGKVRRRCKATGPMISVVDVVLVLGLGTPR